MQPRLLCRCRSITGVIASSACFCSALSRFFGGILGCCVAIQLPRSSEFVYRNRLVISGDSAGSAAPLCSPGLGFAGLAVVVLVASGGAGAPEGSGSGALEVVDVLFPCWFEPSPSGEVAPGLGDSDGGANSLGEVGIHSCPDTPDEDCSVTVHIAASPTFVHWRSWPLALVRNSPSWLGQA